MLLEYPSYAVVSAYVIKAMVSTELVPGNHIQQEALCLPPSAHAPTSRENAAKRVKTAAGYENL